MTVISLLQPWATLVVLGAKKIETRSWETPFRGELLIHASLGKHYGTGRDKVSCRELCYQDPFRKYIDGGQAYDKLPFGAIIGKVNMKGCSDTDFYLSCKEGGIELSEDGSGSWEEQLAFGDFSSGRFGWLFGDAIKFDKPIPAKGKQGFWNIDIEI